MSFDDTFHDRDLTPETERLLAAAADLCSHVPLRPMDMSADPAFCEFTGLYREWIIAHHGDSESAPERAAKIQLITFAMVAGATLGEAIEILLRFARHVWGDRGPLDLQQSGATAVLRFLEPARPGVAGLIGDIWALSVHLSQFEFLVGGPVDGVVCNVRQDQLLPASTVRLLVDRPIAFGAESLTLAIPTRHLGRAVVASARDVPEFLRRLLPRALGADRSDPETAKLVAGLLRGDRLHRSSAAPTLANVADRLGCSAATLRRKLAAEGAGFRDIKDSVFDELAKSWLREGLKIEAIAEQLDYSDVFTFRRSFRRLNGVSPTAYRRLIERDPAAA